MKAATSLVRQRLQKTQQGKYIKGYNIHYMVKADLIFPLKKMWYYKIKNGEKQIEYRLVKPYWTKRFSKVCQTNDFKGYIAPIGDKTLRCILRLGYTKEYMIANINKIEVVDGKNTDLKIDAPVYAIYLNGVHEAC